MELLGLVNVASASHNGVLYIELSFSLSFVE